MSKDSTPGGLLSKVVRFVKNPTGNWTELEQKESERESTYSKQALKEMIERKRRNDFVRKREFDMLRKMRRREAMGGTDPTARPSFFQSSMPSKPDDRAMTLKKIDEIEAQMSMQWWKTKNPASSSLPPSVGPTLPPATAPTRPPADDAGPATEYERTEPQPLPAIVSRPKPEDKPMLDLSAGLGRPAPAPSPAAAPSARQTGSAPPRGAPPPAPTPPSAAPGRAPAGGTPKAPLLHGLAGGGYDSPGTTGFTASKLFAVEVAEVAHDAELEEASIRFANGDDAAAEMGLLEALSPNGTRANHEETWLTLFDLYRATGQQAKFDNAAIDFAGRFGRSAPLWFSIPEMVGRMASAAPAPVSASAQASDWVCPSTLDTQGLAALNASLAKAPPPWRLDWNKLQTIEDGACEALMRQFSLWSAQPVQLRFVAAQRLDEVLRQATPSGNRQVREAWWKLRMEALRMMHRPDDFELVALDYCVTYEVSPPSWERARCEFKAVGADGASGSGHTIIGEAFRDSVPSSLPSVGFGDTEASTPAPSGPMAQLSAVELAGQITGDAQAALDRLEGKLLGADIMIISCAKLIRVDFSAAGTLLNWVTARQAEGRHVQFSDVHRLVAAFFNVIGISEHARVVPRTD